MAKKKIATIKNPTIEAIKDQLFRFANEAQAMERLETIRNEFVISKDQEPGDPPPSVRLWIRGFSLTDDEVKQGYTGNFAIMRARKVGDGKFSIFAEKEDVDLKLHPQKKRQKHAHPDWGHPVLRHVKKETVFATVEEAHDQLQKLHTEYPEVTIPGRNRLFAIIYSKADQVEKGGKRVAKYIIEIEVLKDGGGFTLTSRLNTKAPRKKDAPKPKPLDGANTPETVEPTGYFTSMVALRKNKKR